MCLQPELLPFLKGKTLGYFNLQSFMRKENLISIEANKSSSLCPWKTIHALTLYLWRRRQALDSQVLRLIDRHRTQSIYLGLGAHLDIPCCCKRKFTGRSCLIFLWHDREILAFHDWFLLSTLCVYMCPASNRAAGVYGRLGDAWNSQKLSCETSGFTLSYH